MMVKLWLTGTLSVCPAGESHVASSLVPKIYKGGIERPDVTLSDQIMNADDFIVLCSKVFYLDLDFVTVNDGDGNPVSFKWLLEHQTPCDHFTYRFRTSFHNTSKADFKELWKIPHLCYYGTLYLVDVPKEFDIDSLLSFLK
uniref:Uncharacterized protein n=1 Tax=Panagrolaimus superbus TaxID=310955 RepID=A0A914YK10_9BILA